MKNRTYFLREDLDTYKPKFKMLCAEKRIEAEIKFEKFAQVDRKDYICRIKIQDL